MKIYSIIMAIIVACSGCRNVTKEDGKKAKVYIVENIPSEVDMAALEKRLREYQVYVIKNGLPPLPIEIDDEMAAELELAGIKFDRNFIQGNR